MPDFAERAVAFEGQYAHQEALRFRVINRRNALFGMWAAERMGLAGEAARTYARAACDTWIATADDSEIVMLTQADFFSAAVDTSRHRIERKLREFEQDALVQVMAA